MYLYIIKPVFKFIEFTGGCVVRFVTWIWTGK